MRDRIRSNLKFSIITVLAMAIIFYAYFETSEVLSGPTLEVISPKNGYSSPSELVEISGNVKNVSYMYLNGRPIFADTSGFFKEKITLSKGYNSIFIETQDRIGNKKSEILELVFSGNRASLPDSLAKDLILAPNL